MPYAYRHSYAQRHADAGVPIDVLAELLDHRSYSVTRRYYRIGEDRRRDAVDTVTALSFDRHGNRIWRDAHALLDSERARHAIGEVAVPYGTCTEPTNVQAGGGACPVRFRCVGCDHFRTNIAFLPDLQAYLDDLLRTRERLAAAIDGVDDWARADATPTEQEITRIRRLINRINGDIAELDDTERAQIDEAVAIVRRHRPPTRSRSACPPAATHPHQHHRLGGQRMTSTDPRTSSAPAVDARSPIDARRSPSRLHAPPPARDRRARPRRRRRRPDQRVRHRPRRRSRPHLPLPAPRPAGENPCAASRSTPPTSSTGPAVTRASLQADLLAAHERAARLNARIRNSKSGSPKRSANTPGANPGSAPPPTSTPSTRRISHLEQQVIDLHQQLDERDEDLAAARAANRELMAQLNTPSRPR